MFADQPARRWEDFVEGTPFGRYSDRHYPRNTAEQQIIAHVTAPPPQPSVRRRGIRPGFDAVIAKGMAKSVGERYQNCWGS